MPARSKKKRDRGLCPTVQCNQMRGHIGLCQWVSGESLRISVPKGNKVFRRAKPGAKIVDMDHPGWTPDLIQQAIKPGIDALPPVIVKMKPSSKATSDNPKNIAAKVRIDTTLVPAIAIAHCADAMMDGADKYDPYNWRAKQIACRAYVAAAKRHLDAWMEGEECAKDSGTHHLGHVMATCAILLDAQEHGIMIDDRLALDGGKALARVRAKVEANVSTRRAKRAKQ